MAQLFLLATVYYHNQVLSAFLPCCISSFVCHFLCITQPPQDIRGVNVSQVQNLLVDLWHSWFQFH